MTNLDRLKKQVSEKVTISDLILASLNSSLATSEGTSHLWKSNALIHKIFYALKHAPEFQDVELLSELTFDESLPTPYSEEIGTALFRIETTHILETNNPSYEWYSVTEENKRYAREAFQKLEKTCAIDKISDFIKSSIEQYTAC